MYGDDRTQLVSLLTGLRRFRRMAGRAEREVRRGPYRGRSLYQDLGARRPQGARELERLRSLAVLVERAVRPELQSGGRGRPEPGTPEAELTRGLRRLRRGTVRARQALHRASHTRYALRVMARREADVVRGARGPLDPSRRLVRRLRKLDRLAASACRVARRVA